MSKPAGKPPIQFCRTFALTVMFLLTAVIDPGLSGAQSYSAASRNNKAPQGLWVLNFQFLDEFQGASLKKSGTPNANIAQPHDFFWVQDLAFDKAGDLWLAMTGVPAEIGELTPSEFKRSKKSEPFKVTIYPAGTATTGPPQNPSSLAFDPAGDMWVTVTTLGDLIEYTPDQLLGGGSLTPAVSWHFPGPTVPDVIRFDSAGNMWLAFPNTTTEFTAAQLAEIQAGGSPTPTLTVEPESGLLSIFTIAFDAKNNLWLSGPTTVVPDPNGVNGGTLEMFDVAGKSGLLTQASVTITPSAISSINQSLDDPLGLAFDHHGNLWVSNWTSSDQGSNGSDSTGFLVKFGAKQLAASGSPVPNVVISPNRKATNLNHPNRVALGPTVK